METPFSVSVSYKSRMIDANGLFAQKMTIHLQNKWFKIITTMGKSVNWKKMNESQSINYSHLDFAPVSLKMN